MKQVICKNCGAKISKDDVECPYCHTMQYEASEKKYMKDLYQLNDNMDQLDEKAFKIIRKQAVRNMVIALVSIIIAVGIGAFMGYQKHLDVHNSKKQQKKNSKFLSMV